MINPQNYKGANTTVVGNATGPATAPAYDKTGGSRQITVAVNQGYKGQDGQWVDTGTVYYDYVAFGDAATALEALGVDKGDKIRIDDARQEVRAYIDGKGEPKAGVTLKFGQVTILETAGL